MRRNQFAIRTIRQGRAKIHGRWFYPSEKFLPYDGRLDGMRYAFGLYWSGDGAGNWHLEDFVYLWGPEELYHNDHEHDPGYGPELIDGYFPWACWRVKEEVA